MFQISGLRFFLLVIVASSLAVFWYLDTNYYHWDRYLPEPEEMVVDTMTDVPEESNQKNITFNTKEFVPTNEWQTIEKGQSIPPGLHVKIDMSTGERSAKLLNKDDVKTSSLAITHSNNSDEITKDSKEQPTNIHKFKSYASLKDDLKELNMTVKTDIEILDDLSAKFQKQIKIYEETDNDLRNILTDLEYLLHQIDTAEVFVKNKGIKSIVIPCINSNSSYLKGQGAFILGSAASNNPKVQIAALEANVIPLLLKHINDEYEFSVQKYCLYALSSISRRFPTAQKKVIDENGIQIYLSIFKRPKSELNTKLKLKVTQLLQDLAVEVEDAKISMIQEINDQLSLESKERVRQYNELHFMEKLVENGWCDILRDEFISLSNSLPTNEEGHAIVDAFGKSLLLINDLCSSKLLGNKQLYKSLYALESYYKNLSHDDHDFDYLHNIMNELTNFYDPVLE